MQLKACCTLLAVAVGGLAVSGPVRADVKYTETTTMETKGKGSAMKLPPSRTTTYLKAGLQRVDTNMAMGPMTMKNISVSNCPEKLSLRFDPELKIYTSGPLFSDKPEPSKPEAAKPEAKPAKAPKGTGKITISAEVKYLGIEEVAGRKARHYSIVQKMTPEGCAGKDGMTMNSEIWVTDYDMPAFNCRSPWVNDVMTARNKPVDGGCSLSFAFVGDMDKLSEAYRGLVVKRKTVVGDMTMTSQLTEFSEAKLDDALFKPEASWKQVSDAEFDKKQQSAMMNAMMSGMGGFSGLGGAANAGGNAGGGNADGGNAGRNAPPPNAGGGEGTMGEATMGEATMGEATMGEATTEDAPPKNAKEEKGKSKSKGKEESPTAEDVAKEVGKQKLKKKLKLPF